MRLHQLAAVMLLAGTSTVLVSCGGTESTASDEAAIKAANTKWMELIVAKDAKSIASEIYGEDGQMMPPNAPVASGREAIEKGWTPLVNIPGVQITFETSRLVFAKSGDLAVENGTYKFVVGEGADQSTDIGKSTVTWQKKDGKWQVLSDMFSSDAPAVPAAPAAPAEAAPAPAAEGTTPATAPAATPATPATPPAH